MSITVLNYHNQALVDSVNAKAAERAEALAKAAEAAAASANSDFSTVLNETSNSYANTQNTSSGITCPENLNSIFEEAAATYGVSKNLLTAIAKAESGFNAGAVSHAGAVGIMQLMPGTAASLGVSNSYDPRENIMGGAKLISQLLIKYNGNTSLALAAYNAGSGNVDKYGGIPPFTETQNYVKKVLSYMSGTVTVPTGSSSDTTSATNTQEKAKDLLQTYFSSQKFSKNTLELLAALMELSQSGNNSGSTETAATPVPAPTVPENTNGSESVAPVPAEDTSKNSPITPDTPADDIVPPADTVPGTVPSTDTDKASSSDDTGSDAGSDGSVKTDTPTDTSSDASVDVPIDTSSDKPVDTSTDPSVDIPIDTSSDKPADTSTDPSVDVPVDNSTNPSVSVDVPVDNSTDKPADTLTDS